MIAFRPGHRHVPYVPSRVDEGQALDRGGGDRGPRGRDADRDRRHRVDERRRGRGGCDPRDRRHRHRPPSPARRTARGRRHRQPAACRLGLPGCWALGVWRRVHRGPAAARRAGRRRGGGPRPRRPRDDRDGLGRRADRRREPGDRPAGPGADAPFAAPRDRGPARTGRDAVRRDRPRDGRVRARAAAQRGGRVGGDGRRATLLAATRRSHLAVILEEANATART